MKLDRYGRLALAGIGLAILAGLLAGCERTPSMEEACASNGYRPGASEFLHCLQVEQNRRMAVLGMMRYPTVNVPPMYYPRAAAPAYQQPRTTHCVPLGNGLFNCTTY